MNGSRVINMNAIMTILGLCLWYTNSHCCKLLGIEYYQATLSKYLSLDQNQQNSLLIPFNSTRIPNTENSKKVQEFMLNYFRQLDGDWEIEVDNFNERGYKFTNYAFTLGMGDNLLVLAAHYDSKIVPEGFIGGIDSAASCAILLYVSKWVDKILQQDTFLLKPLLRDRFTGIKIVFFDGEEALVEWSSNDSLYGSKSLSAKWELEGVLEKIHLFVLLDLLGSIESVKVPSFFSNTHNFYELLWKIETCYDQNYPSSYSFLDPQNKYFFRNDHMVIEDDHIPFLKKGVPILHLIPFPFPSTWHTSRDDFSNLSNHAIKKWAVIICEFILEYY